MPSYIDQKVELSVRRAKKTKKNEVGSQRCEWYAERLGCVAEAVIVARELDPLAAS